ncbi:MAG: hypothetical protein ACR2NP_04760 [Pirellulaceae bacterium]
MLQWKIKPVSLVAVAFALLLLAPLVVEAQPGRALVAGDEAPNFKLKTVDGSQQVELADFDQPVVLFFGSFT